MSLNDTYTISPTLLNQSTVTFLRSTSISNSNQTVTHDQIGVNDLPFYPGIGAAERDHRKHQFFGWFRTRSVREQ